LKKPPGRFFKQPEQPEVLPKKPGKSEALLKKTAGFYKLNLPLKKPG